MVCVGLFLSAMCPYNILKVYAHNCFYLVNLALHFERNYFWEEKTRLSTVSVVSIAKTDDLSKSTQLWAKTGCYGNAAACRPIRSPGVTFDWTSDLGAPILFSVYVLFRSSSRDENLILSFEQVFSSEWLVFEG